MIHCGSRGFGHQVATDALVSMEKAMKRDKIEVNDRQLACARIQSKEGQDYLKVNAGYNEVINGNSLIPGNGLRGKFRLGQQKQYDVSNQTSFRQNVQSGAGRSRHAGN